jgi:hypothetical protein
MVNISTNALASAARPKGMGGYWFGLLVFGIVFAGWERVPRRTGVGLGIATLFLLIVMLGCSGSKTLITNNNNVTPTGISAVTITASSGSQHATGNLTLTVVQ